jgi:hypothetical protein
MGLFDKEPALIIGTIVTIVVGAIATLSGNGFISDAVAGKATDLVNSIAQLLLLLAPLITAYITRGQVYSPATVAEITDLPLDGTTDVAGS